MARKTLRFWLAVLIGTCAAAPVMANDEQLAAELAKSEQWQVRYCVPTQFDVASPLARQTLEALCRDSETPVAQEAFGVYTSLFVSVDKPMLRNLIPRLNFWPVGADKRGERGLSKAETYVELMSGDVNEANNGKWISLVGILGEPGDVEKLARFKESANSYVLLQTALALYHLGDERGYGQCIDMLLAEPLKAPFYTTAALRALSQTDRARFTREYERIEPIFRGAPKMQPNWMFAYVLLGRTMRDGK